VVYYDGLPLLIDVGRGTYTRKTFSDKRYDIWYNCSDYHNVPTINDKEQLPGSSFKANAVKFTEDKSFAALSLDISAAYPKDAGVKSWQRSIRLNRTKNVTITDVTELAKAEKITQHLMTCYPAEAGKNGELIIHYKDADGKVKDFSLQYDAKKMKASVERIALTAMEDEGIRQKWGDNIYRINFELLTPKAKDNMKFVVAPGKSSASL
jgi:hypothetical protein